MLGKNIKIGGNVRFGRNVIIYDNVEIGDGTSIEHNSIIGYNNLTHLRPEYRDRPQVTKIGNNVLIRPNAMIYAACELGDYVSIGSNVVMREFTSMGEHSFLGSGVVVEGYTEIGKFTAINAQCHITAKASIGDYVFLSLLVGTANGRRIQWYRDIPNIEQGPIIERGVRVGLGAMILPQVRIGEEALIGASALVTKDIPAFKIAVGVPARVIGDIPQEERLKI